MTDDIDPKNEVESMVDGIYAMARGEITTLEELARKNDEEGESR